MSTSVARAADGARLRPLVGVGIALAVAVVGLLWAKWLPYSERALGLAGSGTWKGTSVLLAGEGVNPLARAWAFTAVYSQAVWKALAVALVVAACVDVLIPRR